MSTNIVKLDEKTWRLEDGFVYYYLLEGNDKALLIDSGITENKAKEVAESITKLPIILANTHGDGDHTGGNGAFSDVYINSADYDNMGMKGKYPNTKLHDISEGYVFDLGGRDVKVIELPGHTYGSVAFLDVNTRVLYAGDTIQDSHVFLFGGHRCPDRFKDSLVKVIGMKDQISAVYSAHGTPILDPSFAENMLSDWESVLNKTLEGKKEEMFGNPVITYNGKYCGFYC